MSINSRGDVNVYFSVVHVEETAKQHVPLKHESSDDHVEADSGESVAPEERHEESETDEDHHVHVLKHCEKKKAIIDM